MKPTDIAELRLPAAVVRRTFILHTAAVLGVLVVFHLLTQQESLAALGGAASLAALALVVGYASTARRVWLTLTPAGMATVGYTGRKVELPWSTPVTLSPSRRSGYKGHTVAVFGSGFLSSSTSAVFIPTAIANTPEFGLRVAAWAPAAHPVRALIEQRA